MPYPTSENPRDFGFLNEVCQCGHKRLAHLNTFAQGHGECLNTHCNCIKYTFDSHTTLVTEGSS